MVQGKSKTAYQCESCGAAFPKWAGQCGDCGAWNSLVEVAVAKPASGRHAGYAGADDDQPQALADVSLSQTSRSATGVVEFDRVLGGGLVAGSVILIGGDPGIGKSTLLLQTLLRLAEHSEALYVSGEESKQQIRMRATRVGFDNQPLKLLSETCVERIIHQARPHKPAVLAIDSIQTLFTEQLQSAPGSVAQVRESAAQLVRYAKQNNTSLFLIGHVTKEGALAGPRVLEHMVDTVLYFEGEPGSRYRVIRAIKNRFGAANELGIFAMTERGVQEVSNPSAIFLSRHQQPVPGSIILVTREGTRPLLLELQALVDESHLANPRRLAVGLEQNRLAMLLATLHRHAGIFMADRDVFVNVVGGVRVGETAADLPALLAVVSSFKNRPLTPGLVAFGEVGLAGEIRPVAHAAERLKEAAKHGFTRALAPAANLGKQRKFGNLEVIAVERLEQALDAAFAS